MLRTITNYFQGRKKVKDETVNFEKVQELLRRLNKETWIDIIFEYGTKQLFPARKPNEALDIIDVFKPNEKLPYFYGRYQIYSGRSWEKHYIDIKAEWADQAPPMRATIDFLIE